ncbi:hypothetical protein [Bacillus xiapuensis]|uniref:hypothetical protein n=1 Tax=Bacillus xiapuensis TaxID=2014075 RepID=UPI000C24C7E0|nr:hypothetical protein [Bacillus xiapuensis]
MRGSIFWNIWSLIAGFTLYFLLSFTKGEPLPVIAGSFAAGAVFFILTFIVRWMLHVAFPPGSYADMTEYEEQSSDQNKKEEMPAASANSDGEVNPSEKKTEINSEKTAAVIRNMMNE